MRILLNRRKFLNACFGGGILTGLYGCELFGSSKEVPYVTEREASILDALRAALTHVDPSIRGEQFFVGRAKRDPALKERYKTVTRLWSKFVGRQHSGDEFVTDAKHFLQSFFENTIKIEESEREIVQQFVGDCFLYFSSNEAWTVVGYESPPGVAMPLEWYEKKPQTAVGKVA